MIDPLLICMMGLPRSGKTTRARELGFPIVNPDAIRLAVHGQRFYPPAEPLVWATAELMVRSLFLAGHATVIVDATNMTADRRARWRSKEWRTEWYFVATPPDECLRRAAEAGDEDIRPVIERMHHAFQPLGPEDVRFVPPGSTD